MGSKQVLPIDPKYFPLEDHSSVKLQFRGTIKYQGLKPRVLALKSGQDR